MKKVALVMSLLLLILLGGCSKTAAPSKTTEACPPSSTTPNSVSVQPNQNTGQEAPGQNSGTTQKKLTFNLYFPDKNAMYLVKVPKEVTVTDGAVVKAIIAELQKGDANYGKVIPQEAKLLNATIKDGIVNLDFSKEFRDKHWGGSSGESFTVYGIVDSLTELPNIKGVQFYLEGQIQESMLGHMDWSKPFTRNEQLLKK